MFSTQVEFCKITNKALLALEDGTLFYGTTSSQAPQTVCGEVIFNTSMTGYQEICTDPSYTNQIIVFTTPHIGNVGVNEEDHESIHPCIKGVIAREISKKSSSWRSEKEFIELLDHHKTPWIEGIDTRKLVRHIRKNGTKSGCIMSGKIDAKLATKLARNHARDNKKEQKFISKATPSFTPSTFPQTLKIVIYDFGLKRSILNALASFNCQINIVPSGTSAEELLSYEPDGIIISNGPGDPYYLGDAVEEIRKIIFSAVPVFGICLGCQLIAIAAGGKTKKMPFGHHGANHPVYDIKSKEVYITSQNHGFVIDGEALPPNLEVTHLSLIDSSVQGVRLKNHPVMGFQGHPEGSPGPQDIQGLFTDFLQKVMSYKCR